MVLSSSYHEVTVEVQISVLQREIGTVSMMESLCENTCDFLPSAILKTVHFVMKEITECEDWNSCCKGAQLQRQIILFYPIT